MNLEEMNVGLRRETGMPLEGFTPLLKRDGLEIIHRDDDVGIAHPHGGNLQINTIDADHTLRTI